MAFKQGLIQLDGDPFLYQEQNEIDGHALSSAVGINSVSTFGYSTWTLTVSANPGANPSQTFPTLSIDPVEGDVIWIAPGLFSIVGNLAVSGTILFQGAVDIVDSLNDTSGATLLFQKNRASAVIVSGDQLANITMEGFDGTEYVIGASITATSSGTIAADRVASNLVFSTHPDSASGVNPTTRMTIASTGAITIASPDSGTGLTISGGGLHVTGTTVLGTALGIAYGGTNATATPGTDALIYFNGTSYVGLANGTTGQVLTATTSAAPSWTSTVPGAVDSIAGSVNQIDASSATGNVTLSLDPTLIAPGSIASTSTITAATGLTVTTGGATITAGGLTVTAGNTTLTPLNAAGMVVNSSAGLLSTAATTHFAVQVGSAGGQLTSLATGTANQILQSGGGAANPAWSTATYPATAATGSIIYASGTNTLTTLAAGTTGYVLTMGASVPAWSAAASSGITTLDGDSGSATGSTVTISGVSGVITTTGSGSSIALTTPNIHIVTADHSTYVGVSAGNGSSGAYNTSFGETALGSLSSGNRNTAIGFGAGLGTTSGTYNTFVGLNAAQSANGSGSTYNISIGAASGANLSSGSSNIYLNDAAPGNESNVLRLGSGTGLAAQQLTKAYISGIQGATLAGTKEGIVQVDSNDQLAGTQNPSITGTYTTTAGNLVLPNTNSGGTQGIIEFGSTRFIHNYGGTNAIFIGSNAGTLSNASINAIGIGTNALAGNTDGGAQYNTVIGHNALQTCVNPVNNVIIGDNSCTSAGNNTQDNVFIGYNTGATLTSRPFQSVVIGSQALANATAANSTANILIGYRAGYSFTAGETSNISIGYEIGTVGDNNILRLGGGTGTGTGQQNKAYISGIQGASLAGTLEGIVQVDSNDQLAGTQNPSITGTYTTTAGNIALPSTTSTAGQITINSNPAFHTFGTLNTFVGQSSGNFTTTGTGGNQCMGYLSGTALTTGSRNILLGRTNGTAITTGTNNTAVGDAVLWHLTTGVYNTCIGNSAGSPYTSSESYNIIIGTGDIGVVSESNTCRIGLSTGSGASQINQTFIAGITGISVTGSAVIVNSSGQLGVTVSSERYKDNIEDMGEASSSILDLRPVTFTYKDHPDKTQPGLIAEEVLDIMPELVIYNEDGDVESVRYHDLPVLLLNELQKAVTLIEDLRARVSALENDI